MTLFAGTVTDMADSMAQAIESAFAAEVFAIKGVALPDSSAQERHMLFCAIAQGVLGYLSAHEDELEVAVSGAAFPETSHVAFDYGIAE